MGLRSRLPGVVVLDVDNTLYDWVSHFSRPLRATLFELNALTGRTLPDLQGGLRDIFRKHGTVEYPYYLTDGSLAEFLQLDSAMICELADVKDARSRETLKPYVGVSSGLARLRDSGIRVVCFSDSTLYHLASRLSQLGLLPYVDAIYCSQDYRVEPSDARTQNADLAEIRRRFPDLRIRTLPADLRKPAPAALNFVLDAEGCNAQNAIILGDNLRKDVAMAKSCHAFDVWARYGSALSSADASLLVGVTHWDAGDVTRYFRPSPATTGVVPSKVVDSFHEFVDWIEHAWRDAERAPYETESMLWGADASASTEQLQLFNDPADLDAILEGAPL